MYISGKGFFQPFRFGCIAMILLFISVILLGCSGVPSAVDAGIGEEVTLSVGQSIRINEEGLTITFDEVIGDSRCPRNVTCIWAGVASIRITIDSHDDNYSLALNLPGLVENDGYEFAGYMLVYSLDPYPEAGRAVSEKDYKLILTVKK